MADAKGNNLPFYLVESYNPRQSAEFQPKLIMLEVKGLKLVTPQKDGNTLYHLAVAKNDKALIEMVRPYGADINAKYAAGLTALHKAAMIAKDNCLLEYMLSIVAKKDIETNYKETAYDLASENEYLAKQIVSVDFLKY